MGIFSAYGGPFDGVEGRRAAAEMLAQVLGQSRLDARCTGDAVLLPSGLRLEAALLEARLLEDGRVATVTRVVAFHDALFADGLPELQRAIGADTAQAMAQGFSAWVQGARVALEDAVRTAVRDCPLLAVKVSAPGGGAPTVYQAILGPVLCVGPGPAQPAEDDELCPACMTTRVQDALRGHLRAGGYTGLSLVAGRDARGALAADCRVNGEPFSEGVERLVAYARSWPERGFEFRQQYVILRAAPAVGTPGGEPEHRA